MDRTGVPLALTLEARDVYADPRYVTDPIGEAATIARILDLRPRKVERLLRTPDATFVYLGRQIDAEVADRLEARGLPGIGFLDVPKRYYPAGPLAPQVLGFVGVDATGLAGLEFEYEDQLAGTAGRRTVELSADGLPIASGIEVVEPATPGRTLVTTLDREVQYLAQEALRARGEGERRQGRHGRRDGRADRRRLRDGFVSVVRPERLRGRGARRDPEPRRHRHVRARVGQQGRDGRGGAGDAGPSACARSSRCRGG